MAIYRTWTADDHAELARKVLDVLPDPGRDPVSTSLIRSRFPDLDPFEKERHVRRALDVLAAAGWAERVPADRVLAWRLTPAGKEGRDRGDLPNSH